MSDQDHLRVREVMKSDVDFVDGMATVGEALARMKHVETKCLVVNKRGPQDEVALLLISDIARHVLARDRAPERVNVYEVMRKPVLSVDPEMRIHHCARLLTQFELSRAPVVERREVIGIVSFTDLVLKGMVR